MANKSLFQNRTPSVPVANTRNEAGGRAYARPAEEALAALAVTGTLNGTFYASAETQLDQVLDLAKQCSPDFIADVAVYSRKRGQMKDMGAALLAFLAGQKTQAASSALSRTAPIVLDNGRMIRNFVQMIRSGKFGRKSLGTLPKRIIRDYLERSDCERLFRDSIGNDPSLADVIKLSHPRASNKQKDALFGYLIGSKKFDAKKAKFLPMVVKEMELFKAGEGRMPEQAPFMMLTAFAKSQGDWLALLQRASWTETRMNLNTFQRHGVFDNAEDVVRMTADRIRNPDLIRKARVFPYQLLVAYKHATDIPNALKEALQDALEVATENVPDYGCRVAVAVDVSGSMSSPVTGHRGSATSVVQCREAAALVAASILRTNQNALVLPFSDGAHTKYDGFQLNPRDSVMTNTQKLAALPSGGTDCSLPLKKLNTSGAKVDLVIFCSDNQSWINNQGHGGGTGMMAEWNVLKRRNPTAKLVCIDMAPSSTSQVAADKDILRVGGFSDSVFDVIAAFLAGEGSFVDVVRSGTGSALTDE